VLSADVLTYIMRCTVYGDAHDHTQQEGWAVVGWILHYTVCQCV